MPMSLQTPSFTPSPSASNSVARFGAGGLMVAGPGESRFTDDQLMTRRLYGELKRVALNPDALKAATGTGYYGDKGNGAQTLAALTTSLNNLTATAQRQGIQLEQPTPQMPGLDIQG